MARVSGGLITAQEISFERERAVWVSYRGTPIPGQRVDFVVAEAVIVEVKAVAVRALRGEMPSWSFVPFVADYSVIFVAKQKTA